MMEKTVFERIVLKMLNASKEDVLNNFRILGLLHSEQKCLYCETEMKTEICRDHMDGFRWKYVNTICEVKKTTLSVRHASVFLQFRQPLSQILLIIYCWSSSKNIVQVTSDFNIA